MAKAIIPPIQAVQSPQTISRDPLLLHPGTRVAIQNILDELNANGAPFKLFEGFRSPARQAYLYAQGRTRPGTIITRANAWDSYHQYGLASDLVPYVNGKWDWTIIGREHWWDQLEIVSQENGMETLSWEKPHVQTDGLNLRDLKAGQFPGSGDASWWDNLNKCLKEWKG